VSLLSRCFKQPVNPSPSRSHPLGRPPSLPLAATLSCVILSPPIAHLRIFNLFWMLIGKSSLCDRAFPMNLITPSIFLCTRAELSLYLGYCVIIQGNRAAEEQSCYQQLNLNIYISLASVTRENYKLPCSNSYYILQIYLTVCIACTLYIS
jgi:hypothetical protein